MIRIFIFERKNYLRDLINKAFQEKEVSITISSEIDDAFKKIEFQMPDLIILNEDAGGENLINFCQKFREKYSLILPIILVVSFYFSFDLSKFKNLGIDTIVKPLTEDELKDKILSYSQKDREIVLSKDEESVSISAPEFDINIIIENIKPYIQEEIKKEIAIVLKQLLEVVEKKDA